MNALVTWTELGKGLSGTLDDVGAERGYLRKLICSYGMDHGAEVDLGRWCYRVAPEDRLDPEAAAAALQRAEAELAEVLSEHLERASRVPEARQALFINVVKGWYPVGLDIMRALPAGAAATEEALIGALSAWCERHLPTGETGEETAEETAVEKVEVVAPRADGKVGLRVLDTRQGSG